MKLFRWAALAIALSPVLLPVAALAEGRMVKVGTNSKGYSMYVDRESINRKDFDLLVALPSGGMDIYTIRYACSERRLQIDTIATYSATGQEITRDETKSAMPAYKSNTVGGAALKVACHEIGALGW